MGLRIPSISAGTTTAPSQTGSGITAVSLNAAPTTSLAAGTSVNLDLSTGSIHIPLADASGVWWFNCTNGSVVWNAADEPLLVGVDGPGVPAAIANGSRIAAIGTAAQRFRLNGVEADGPLIYRTAVPMTIQRSEGQSIYEVAIGASTITTTTGSRATVSTTAPSPSTEQFWIDTANGGAVLNFSDGSSWFTT